MKDLDDLVKLNIKELEEYGVIITRPIHKNLGFDGMVPMRRRKTITKVGFAVQVSVAGLAGRFELFLHSGSYGLGIGGAIGGGGTSQIFGVAISSFDVRAPKNPRKGPAITSSVAFAEGVKFAALSGEWGDNMIQGGGIEIGGALSVHPLETSHLVMYEF
jgi:hypothetical protein